MAISVVLLTQKIGAYKSIVLHPQNSNTHPQKQIDLLAKL